MSEEYDYDLTDDGSVAAPVPSPGKVIADGKVRTVNRNMLGWITLLVMLGTGLGLTAVKQSRDSMANAALLHATPTPVPQWLATSSQKLTLPAPTPTAPNVTPVPVMTPMPRITMAYVPPPAVPPANENMQEAAPSTPSPEQVYAAEERVRILEARRASTRVMLDNASDALAQQTQRDQQDLAQGAQMHSTALTQLATQGSNAHQQFLAQHDGAVGYVQTTSPYELTRGTVIHARWLTTLDSTLPGGVLKAMVTETVYDSKTHSIPVLVPGTIITGEGDAHSETGEARYLCIFDRVELPAPDSRKFYMGANNADGPQGENGASVSTDTHAGREFGHAFLYTLLQAGANEASRASTIVDVGGNIGQVLQPSTRSAPTFHQYVGEPLTIIVSQDLQLDAFKESQ